MKGTCGYVLIRYEDEIYKVIEQGSTFGHLELAADSEFISGDSNQMRRSNTTFDLLRRFTIQALENCDLLVVPINDLIKMKFEFPKYFTELFKNAKDKLRTDFIDKVEVIQDHEKEDKEEHEKDQNGNLKSRFAYAFLGRLINKLKNNNDGNSQE